MWRNRPFIDYRPGALLSRLEAAVGGRNYSWMLGVAPAQIAG